MRATIRNCGQAALAIGLAGLLASTAEAQDRGVVFANAYSGEGRYASVGATIALPGVAEGFAVRAGVMAGSYDYASGAAVVEGEYTGGDVSAVKQWSGALGYANLALGARYTDTELTPADPGNDREGGQWDVLLAVDGGRDFGAWRVAGYASYGFDMTEYFTRVDATRAVGASGLRLGVEAGAQGDPNYERQIYGLVVSIAPSPAWQIRLSGGASHETMSDGGYGAIGLVRTF